MKPDRRVNHGDHPLWFLICEEFNHELVSTVANRIVEITPDGVIDRMMGFEEYLEAG